MSRIDTSELQEALADILRNAEGVTLEPEMIECRDLVHKQYKEQFDSQHGPNGEAWAPWFLTEEPGIDHDTLFVSGALKESYTEQTSGHVEEIQPRMMRTGSELSYAWIHDEGAVITTGVDLWTRDGRGFVPAGSTINIPQRRVSGFADKTLDDCTNVVADGLQKKLLGA